MPKNKYQFHTIHFKQLLLKYTLFHCGHSSVISISFVKSSLRMIHRAHNCNYLSKHVYSAIH